MNKDVHATPTTVPFDSPDRHLGVIVGFDGSTSSIAALHYGARAARRRNTALTVVSAYSVSPSVHSPLADVPDNPESEAKYYAAERLLDEARQYLRDYSGDVSFRAESGDATGILVGLSPSAQLAVVGARGRGGFLGRIIGSVAEALPGYAECPTVVVPQQYQAEGGSGDGEFSPVQTDTPVVVGVDKSRESRAALLQAAQAAEDREISLEVTMALPLPGTLLWYPELKDSELLERRRTELGKFLEQEKQWLKQYFPALNVTVSLIAGEPAAVLSEASGSAQLTVLGTHGRGGFSSAMLGSVSRGVLHKAHGPVMVVPFVDDPRLEDSSDLDADL